MLAELEELPVNRLVLLPDFEGPVRGPIVLTAAEAAHTPEDDGEVYSLTPDEITYCLHVVAQWPTALWEESRCPSKER